jgi:hypothetical protein
LLREALSSAAPGGPPPMTSVPVIHSGSPAPFLGAGLERGLEHERPGDMLLRAPTVQLGTQADVSQARQSLSRRWYALASEEHEASHSKVL